MRRVFAVIGANWGDEGKGLMTNSLSSKFENSIVIRSNGGAQAGHTVELPDGRRHIHSHFGSGTLNGTPTFLSKYFITNPKEFFLELRELEEIGIANPKVFSDIHSLVTTPYDVIINQTLERKRGSNKHGSCGLGINETVERSYIFDQKYMMNICTLLFSRGVIKRKMELIREEWVPLRAKELGITLDESIINSDRLIEDFIDQCKEYLKFIKINHFDNNKFLLEYDNIIFEGAQGLLLHEDSKFFPYVTRSKTGLENCVAIAEQIGIDEINPIYMSRCYMTKHGAGELPNELPKKPYEGIIDLTNQPNQFQDSLRFSLLDVNLLESSIKEDMNKVSGSSCRIKNPTVAITCLDQVAGNGKHIDNIEKQCDIPTLLERCKNITGRLMTSWSSQGDKIYDYN